MAADSTPVRAVIFDIGATLVTGPPVAPNKVIAALLDGVTAAEVASVIMTQPFKSPEDACIALAKHFGDLPNEAVQGIADLWESQCSAAFEIEGATQAVLDCVRRGLRIGLLSDIWSPYYACVAGAVPRVIEAAASVVLSCETGLRKPNPDNFLLAISELDVAPAEAVMVGDTYSHDILPAVNLGMRTVWVLARPGREIDSVLGVLNGRLPHPTATVASINDVCRSISG